MKKYFFLFLVASAMIFWWCASRSWEQFDVASITDLDTLHATLDDISGAMHAGTVSMETAQDILDVLEQKYIDLTDIPQVDIEDQMSRIHEVFQSQSLTPRGLPLWAKRLGLVVPQGMTLDMTQSRQSKTSDTSFILLVYTGSYDHAMQQAERIATKAHLYVSKEFQKAQALAQYGEVGYISGLDIDGLMKWIVYVNAELLDTATDPLISLSVDKSWTLTLELTKKL